MKSFSVDRPMMFKKQIIHPWLKYVGFGAALQTLAKENDPRSIRVDAAAPQVPWWDGKRPVENMLVFGGGGMGDRIQSTPALRKLANKIGRPVDVAISDCEEWEGLPYIGIRHPWLLPASIIDNYDAVCSFEDVLGREDEATVHLAELFARRLFVSPLIPGVTMPDSGEFDCDWAWKWREADNLIWTPEKEPSNLWIGLQVASQGYSRTWPIENVIALAEKLARCQKHKIIVMLLGTHQQSPKWGSPLDLGGLPSPPQDRVVNLCGRLTGTRQLATLVNRLDLLIAPDSGPLHIAGVLGIPSIGLYGPHIHETRGMWFPNQKPMVGVDNLDDRCPCYCHSDQQTASLPCGQDYCKLMASIGTNDVYEVTMGILDGAKASREAEDVTCPRCRKVLKSKLGRDRHIRNQHPELAATE